VARDDNEDVNGVTDGRRLTLGALPLPLLLLLGDNNGRWPVTELLLRLLIISLADVDDGDIFGTGVATDGARLRLPLPFTDVGVDEVIPRKDNSDEPVVDDGVGEVAVWLLTAIVIHDAASNTKNGYVGICNDAVYFLRRNYSSHHITYHHHW
jgi:hypothetical protein